MTDEETPTRVANRDIFEALQKTNDNVSALSNQVTALETTIKERIPAAPASVEYVQSLEGRVRKLETWRALLIGAFGVLATLVGYGVSIVANFIHA